MQQQNGGKNVYNRLQGQGIVNIISTKDAGSIRKPCARKLRRKVFGVQGKSYIEKERKNAR
jgi:hypothetical protein